MVYIDTKTFRCYTEQDAEETRIPDDEPMFIGKCKAFIEGHCCIPDGYSLADEDGTIICPGRAVYPWKDNRELENVQREYERQLLKEYQENSIPVSELEAAYQEGVNSAYD